MEILLQESILELAEDKDEIIIKSSLQPDEEMHFNIIEGIQTYKKGKYKYVFDPITMKLKTYEINE